MQWSRVLLHLFQSQSKNYLHTVIHYHLHISAEQNRTHLHIPAEQNCIPAEQNRTHLHIPAELEQDRTHLHIPVEQNGIYLHILAWKSTHPQMIPQIQKLTLYWMKVSYLHAG